ncbi:hypothetical protein GALMADRAFT_233707 [Galerina marginata CBS 339.88]|uniref:prephenate dehydratase n=1 Tax=Galerina marginata (strain CBS 339.88) TaxID=685588 RepID=A0A067TPF2_GALM3|nr:hypothetical protein GALMADRAFT_233707 [Galerina marginata CBS 339.88]
MGNKKLKIAVLGPLGTYTHEAAFQKFGQETEYDERNSIADVFRALSPEVPLGVVPQENSIFGIVIETYDILRSPTANFIRGEITLKVEHCLLVRKGVKLNQIQRVMSHEQALGQCRDFIAEKLPSASAVKTPSTAAAAKALLDSPPDCAAICSSICATLFEGLEVLFIGIQNDQSNFTRFFIVSHSQHTLLPPIIEANRQMKALILMPTPPVLVPDPNKSRGIIEHLGLLGLFATRIDRRPSLSATPFGSVYFVEVQKYSTQVVLGNDVESWTRELENSVSRVNYAGGVAILVGIW